MGVVLVDMLDSGVDLVDYLAIAFRGGEEEGTLGERRDNMEAVLRVDVDIEKRVRLARIGPVPHLL